MCRVRDSRKYSGARRRRQGATVRILAIEQGPRARPEYDSESRLGTLEPVWYRWHRSKSRSTARPLRMIQSTTDGILLRVHVVLRASRAGTGGVRQNALVVRLNSAPVDGAANESSSTSWRRHWPCRDAPSASSLANARVRSVWRLRASPSPMRGQSLGSSTSTQHQHPAPGTQHPAPLRATRVD